MGSFYQCMIHKNLSLHSFIFTLMFVFEDFDIQMCSHLLPDIGIRLLLHLGFNLEVSLVVLSIFSWAVNLKEKIVVVLQYCTIWNQIYLYCHGICHCVKTKKETTNENYSYACWEVLPTWYLHLIAIGIFFFIFIYTW